MHQLAAIISLAALAGLASAAFVDRETHNEGVASLVSGHVVRALVPEFQRLAERVDARYTAAQRAGKLAGANPDEKFTFRFRIVGEEMRALTGRLAGENATTGQLAAAAASAAAQVPALMAGSGDEPEPQHEPHDAHQDQEALSSIARALRLGRETARERETNLVAALEELDKLEREGRVTTTGERLAHGKLTRTAVAQVLETQASLIADAAIEAYQASGKSSGAALLQNLGELRSAIVQDLQTVLG